ncbi:hypothetical protein IAR55_006227 [Kwoniella newhampshirensis]|uniref:BZIP domain-containing protein n=1 Tax=Kwoniella newhampshirensis TaxID=1651941 RepID=A0AAW0YU77_9TREE
MATDLDEYHDILRQAEVDFAQPLDDDDVVMDGTTSEGHPAGVVQHHSIIADEDHDDGDFVVMEDQGQGHGQEPVPEEDSLPAVLLGEEDDQSTRPLISSLQDESVQLPAPNEFGGFGGGDESDDMVNQNGRRLTAAEKKERQKAQNRKAAERSRNKRRGELMALELNVANMQDENQRLRARLSSLLNSRQPSGPSSMALQDETGLDHLLTSSGPAGPSTSPAPPAQIVGSGIDHNYVSKLINELVQAKTTVLMRSLELSSLKDGQDQEQQQQQEGDDSSVENVKEMRKDLLGSHGKLIGLRAELESLKSMVEHLKSEQEGLGVQRARVLKELEGRRAVRDAVASAEGERTGAEEQEGGAEDAVAAVTAEEIGNPDPATEEAPSEGRDGPDTGHGGARQNGEEQVQGEEEEEGHSRGAGVDKALLDIRGWIDQAVKDWDREPAQVPNEGA